MIRLIVTSDISMANADEEDSLVKEKEFVK